MKNSNVFFDRCFSFRSTWMRNSLFIIITLVFLTSVLFPTAIYAKNNLLLGTNIKNATQLGITGTSTTQGNGIKIPNDPKPYYFRFFANKNEKFTFKLTHYEPPSVVTLKLEVLDSSGKSLNKKASTLCSTSVFSGKCQIKLDSKALPAGYYFVTATFTPSGVYDQGMPYSAYLTWNISGTSKSKAVEYVGKGLNGFMDRSAKEHWYKISNLTPGQSAQFSLNAVGKRSNLDVYVYDGNRKVLGSSTLGTGKYPEKVSFKINTSTIYFKIINTGKTATEYSAEVIGK